MPQDGGSGIKHLRAQGAFLYKRTGPQHLTLVSTKENVADVPYDRVTEAFGVENWPHLMHLLTEGDEVLKKRVLVALTEVFKQPQELVMCMKHGALELIEVGILDDNKEIQELSAKVLSVVSKSPCGKAEIMKSKIVPHTLKVFAPAANKRTCYHLYDALLSISRLFVGAQSLTNAGYMAVVLDHLKRNLNGDLQLRALQLLKHILNDGMEATVYRALEMDAVNLCAKRLYDAKMEIRVAACDAIAAMGYVEKTKKAAVEKGVVKKLCHLLTDSTWQVTAASAGALMCLAIHDDVKRAVVAHEGLQNANQLLESPKFLVQLNTLKLLTIMAAFPPARRLLDISSTEHHIRTLMADSDALIAKSAKLALHAVQWKA
uniref:Armadillo repeat-containing domain-containing protein n=1 Tax=Globisporangium ultimum (strain ATCC 200006 / CBS 805.95 / DAOM BR144) TaxID=431595 RepID=K3WB43_GLOUD